MISRMALAAVFTLAIVAAGTTLLLIILVARAIEPGDDWPAGLPGAGIPDTLSPADLAALQEEARRITGETP